MKITSLKYSTEILYEILSIEYCKYSHEFLVENLIKRFYLNYKMLDLIWIQNKTKLSMACHDRSSVGNAAPGKVALASYARPGFIIWLTCSSSVFRLHDWTNGAVNQKVLYAPPLVFEA